MPAYLLTVLVTGSPEESEALAEQHRTHMRELRERGHLRLAGAFKNTDGGFLLLEVEDRHAAEAAARSSPLVEAGLATWTLREWTEVDPNAA